MPMSSLSQTPYAEDESLVPKHPLHKILSNDRILVTTPFVTSLRGMPQRSGGDEAISFMNEIASSLEYQLLATTDMRLFLATLLLARLLLPEELPFIVQRRENKDGL